MAAQNPFLPITEPERKTEWSIVHPKYMVSLLPPGVDPDDPWYRGDIYEDKPSAVAKKWEGETQGPYLEKLRRSLKSFPDIAYLVSRMEVSTSVSRYKYFSTHESDGLERARLVRVTQVDFKHGHPPMKNVFNDRIDLSEALSASTQSPDSPDARVYVVEDLSRDVVELLGSAFDVDPHFFRAHVNDYMWNSITADAVEQRPLDLVSRQRSHFTLRYLRPRYYPTMTSFERATKQAAHFNVLKQLDSDRSRETLQSKNGSAVTLMRGKAILLVDPTPSEGYPLWDGYSSFSNWTTEVSPTNVSTPPRTSLYEDVIYWICTLNDTAISNMINEPNTCALPALWLMLSDWHHVIQYMTSQLGQIEWEIELPGFGKGVKADKIIDDEIMKKLHPWRRNVTLYRSMVAEAIGQLFPKEMQGQGNQSVVEHSLPSLLRDFQIILEDIDEIQTHIAQLVSVATALQSLEESRRALNQNNNVARLTYLATLFIPLSFVSGCLSMEPDITRLRQTFWIFFAIATPLTAVALLTADFLHLRMKMEQVWARRRMKTS